LKPFDCAGGPLALSSLSNFMNHFQRTCVYEELLRLPDAYYRSLAPFDCAGGPLALPNFQNLSQRNLRSLRLCGFLKHFD